jgi:hypothetical protein
VASYANDLPLPQDDNVFLRTAHQIYVQYGKFPKALALAFRLWDRDLIWQDLRALANPYALPQAVTHGNPTY